MADFPISTQYLKVVEFVRTAGDEANEQVTSAQVVTTKDGGRDVTTNFDYKIEQAFYDLCKADFPDYGFVGEEITERNSTSTTGYVWHIDPIDGTKFYAKAIPLWGVTVALVQDDQPVFGIIYNPVSKQMYVAERGKGAYLNGVRLHIDPAVEAASTQLAIDFFIPQTDPDKKVIQDKLLTTVFDTFYRVRGIGLGSLPLAWVAQGLFSAYFGWGLTKDKFVDVAAFMIIAEEAGAEVSLVPIAGNELAAIVATPKIAAYLRSLL